MGDKYRAYYIAGMIVAHGEPLKRMVCIIESKDGINWERPKIGLYECHDFNNNVILRQDYEEPFANFFVFIDTNPSCPKDERFKGISMRYNKEQNFPADRELWCYTLEDDIRFKWEWNMTDGAVKNGGIFDSLNTAYWDDNM